MTALWLGVHCYGTQNMPAVLVCCVWCPHVHPPRVQEAVALVSKLQYNALFDPAVKRVFGKTLVCRTLEAASQLAKSDELDCVTLDGERGVCG